jgi:hypothetical protein
MSALTGRLTYSKISVAVMASVVLLAPSGCQAHRPADVPPHHTCPPLPDSFTSSDLVGTWKAEYFGGLATDLLIIREDGTYKQIYQSDPLGFESDWQPWWLDRDSEGYALLHLEGMRRCDDLETICNNPGGGLPSGELAINICKDEYIAYSGEVVLFVFASPLRPRGLELFHARLAGSDWTYSFALEQ